MKTQQAVDRSRRRPSATSNSRQRARGLYDALGMRFILARTKKQGGRCLFERRWVQLKLNRMYLLTGGRCVPLVMRVAWEHDHKGCTRATPACA